MNTNPQAKRILCFGDSLTFGKVPGENKRYSPKERWPAILQDLLGEKFEIIEDGVRSRTTNIVDPMLPGRNGLDAFLVALLSHLPLDLIIILLGTNDLKNRFNRSTSQIASSLKDYLDPLENATKYLDVPKPKLLILSPTTVIDSKIPPEWDFKDGQKRSLEFPLEFEKVAKEMGADFLNLQDFLSPSEIDGVHFNLETNQKLAKVLSGKIKTFLDK